MSYTSATGIVFLVVVSNSASKRSTGVPVASLTPFSVMILSPEGLTPLHAITEARVAIAWALACALAEGILRASAVQCVGGGEEEDVRL